MVVSMIDTIDKAVAGLGGAIGGHIGYAAVTPGVDVDWTWVVIMALIMLSACVILAVQKAAGR